MPNHRLLFLNQSKKKMLASLLDKNNLISKEKLARINPFKRLLFTALGIITYRNLNWVNKVTIKNGRVLASLPQTNVLFVSNHQTYFADVITLFHTFFSARWGLYDSLSNPVYLLNPKVNCYFVAAEETMKKGLLPRLFKLGGGLTVKRTWRQGKDNVQREVDPNDTSKILEAINKGWVITFPQGTTKPYAAGRKGTAHIIKQARPVVVPVVINGFRRAFDKKGLFPKKKGVPLSIRFKEPLTINYDADADVILSQIIEAIEQSETYKFQSEV